MRLITSLRGELLAWLGLPLLLLWILSVYTHYQSGLAAANQAYDRSLLASARTVAERLVVRHQHLEVDVPWVVLDSFERNMNDRLFYQVISPQGKTLSGYDGLPPIPATSEMSEAYPALVHFYDGFYQKQRIRVAALWQPVSEAGVEGMALVLIALLLASMMLRRVLRPLRRLSKIVLRRDGAELTPLPSLPWSELQPLIVAFNRYLERLRKLLARQDRFSADAAHQLRTPLTILKTQISTALDSDRPEQWRESLQSMHYTLDDTILLTDRLLQLARIKARHGEDKPMTRVDLAAVVREACLSRYAAARAKQIDLGYEGDEHCEVKGDALLLGELCANLLDNAIKYTPAQGIITARVENGRLQIEDSGPGISREEQQKALRPFIRLDNAAMQAGAGIGLALVQDICAWHGAAVTLESSPLLGGLRVSVNFSADRP